MNPSSSQLEAQLVTWLADDPELDRAALIERVRHRSPLLDSSSISVEVDRALGRVGGLGPIEALFARPGITEIMVNGPGPLWVDGPAGMAPTDVVLSAAEIDLVIDRVLDPLGLRVDRTSPVVDARLADGSRVNVVVPPLALDGPVITIRRFGTRQIDLDEFGPPQVVKLLQNLVKEQATVLVAGGTGAGKTTLLNALGQSIPDGDRVIVIEDTTELRLPGRHIIRLEARPANSEGVGGFTIRQLVRNALRMRPDRLVVGEVRGGEALDLLLALNTGHEGSLATCHANSCDAALRRLETLTMLAEVDLPLAAISQQIVNAVDVVIHVRRSRSGGRSISSIGEVVESEGRGAVTNELWPVAAHPPHRAPVRRAIARMAREQGLDE